MPNRRKPPKVRKLSPRELRQLRRKHQRWLASNRQMFEDIRATTRITGADLATRINTRTEDRDA